MIIMIIIMIIIITEMALLRIARRGTACQIQSEDKLEKLELTNLTSMRVSNRIIPPSEHPVRCGRGPGVSGAGSRSRT